MNKADWSEIEIIRGKQKKIFEEMHKLVSDGYHYIENNQLSKVANIISSKKTLMHKGNLLEIEIRKYRTRLTAQDEPPSSLLEAERSIRALLQKIRAAEDRNISLLEALQQEAGSEVRSSGRKHELNKLFNRYKQSAEKGSQVLDQRV